MNDDFEFPAKCHIWKTDTDDIAGLLTFAAQWIERTPNIAIQDIVANIDDDRSSLMVYYTELTPLEDLHP